MSDVPTFNTRNTLTGKLQRVTADQILPQKKYLEVVADDAKPYAAELFKPGEVGEFKNPEPEVDAVVAAQAAYDAVVDQHSPHSKQARLAKSDLDAAMEQAKSNAAAAAEMSSKLSENANSEGESQ